MSYLKNISRAIQTSWKGMSLSIHYFFQARKKRREESVFEENYFEKQEGTFTVQYPKENIPIPDHGRYQLHNEIDDCIVCDKCAKICPVDCIDIEPIRSPEVFGQTSDGTPLRIHAAKFDIDMAKCCFCGLCTVVCPTECLTMTKEFDFSTSNILDHNFSFSKMSEQEIAEKQKEFDDYQSAKTKTSESTTKVSSDSESNPTKPVMKKTGAKSVMKKPVMKPTIKPNVKPITPDQEKETSAGKKPMVKPRIPKKK